MFRTVPLSIIRGFLLYIQQWYMSGQNWVGSAATKPNHFRPDPASKLSANLYDIHQCYVCSEKLLIMDRGTVRNM